MLYDIAIIGAGVIGSMIARELSMFHLKICLLDKENDVSMGASKANSGIVHAGYDAAPGSLKAKFNVAGCAMMAQTAKDLAVSYKQCGSIVAASDPKGMDALKALYQRGQENNVSDLYLLNKEETRNLEPNIHEHVVGSLYAKNAGIISPYGLTIAAAENAVNNGVTLKLNFKATGIQEYNGFYAIQSPYETIHAIYVINAAGVFADTIAGMVEEPFFTILPRRGEYVILDKTEGRYVHTVIFQPPSEKGKGILVTPTVDGNLLLGPTASLIREKEDTGTTAEGIQEVIKGALDIVPGLNLKKIITSFSGIRATPSTGDFIIQPSKHAPRFFHVAGIESPGLTAAPAIALYVVEMLESAGVPLIINQSSVRTRQGIPKLAKLSPEERNAKIKENKAYGNIICRCEQVSEGEIVDSIHRSAGATTVDGVKRRVRAGMGRCQGSFCMPRVMDILARELGSGPCDVCKDRAGSELLSKKEEVIL